MKKRFCIDCNKERDVFEETIQGEEYLTCSKCGEVIAKIDFDWQLPIDMSTPTVYNDDI